MRDTPLIMFEKYTVLHRFFRATRTLSPSERPARDVARNENGKWIPAERGEGYTGYLPPTWQGGLHGFWKKEEGGYAGYPPYIFLSTAARFRKYQYRSSTRNPAFSRNERFSENSFPGTINSGSV